MQKKQKMKEREGNRSLPKRDRKCGCEGKEMLDSWSCFAFAERFSINGPLLQVLHYILPPDVIKQQDPHTIVK